MSISALFRGVADLLAAIPYLLARPKLLRYVLAPFTLALAIAALMLWWMSGHIDPWVQSAISFLPGFVTSWAGPTLRVLLWIGFLGLGYVFFVAIVSVLTTPFCEMLSEAVEEEHTGKAAPPFSLATLVRDLLLGITHSIRRILLFLGSVILLFILGTLIPVVGTFIALALGAWFTSRFAAYDCYDTVWARKGTSYQDKTNYLKTHRSYATGLGLGVAAMALVPVANALAFPLGSIAATRAYLHQQQDLL